MGKIRKCVFCVIFSLSFLSSSFSQTIVLKSGQKVEGRIIEQTNKYTKLEFQGIELIFYSDEISSIEQTSPDGSSTLTPQMELLYKAYTASLDASKPTKEDAAKEATRQVLLEKTSREGRASASPQEP